MFTRLTKSIPTLLNQSSFGNLYKNNSYYLNRKFFCTLNNNTELGNVNQTEEKPKDYYNTAVALKKKHKSGEILALYQKNLPFNKFDEKFYTNTMKVLKDARRFNEALQVYKDFQFHISQRESSSGQIEEDMKKPDKFILTTLMACYAGLGDMDKALEIFHQIPEESDNSCIPYTIIINGYLDINKIDLALEWLDKLGHSGKTFDTISMNYLLSKLAKIGQFTFCDSLIKQMKKNDLKLDAYSYTGLINGLNNNFEASGNSTRLANTIQQVMDNQQYLKMDHKLVSSMMQGLELLKKHSQILDLYKKYKNVLEIDREALFPLIWAFRNEPSQYPDLLNLWSKVKGLVNHHKIFVHYLRALESIEHTHHVQGKKVEYDLTEIIKTEISYAHSKSMDFSKNIDVYNTLIRSYLRRDQITEAWNVFQYSVNQQIADKRTFVLILKYLCESATQSTVIHNNVVEILTSSYFINIIEKEKDSNYSKFYLWAPLLSKFIESNQHQEILTILNLIHTYTTEDIKEYFYILKPYFTQNHPNIDLHQLFKLK
ncbi:hypothetical protein DLAC_02056 [Tieghemostelium lacteum]|uniref:Pentatricopeptide repeat-containing protein n=1 Tax=Tieghemostelium lacteum TaxID=361077 RepID=A0A152A513_TIELA|nr:hypothetical protein DLAC_02056 [Tieghemostelium lacteum]|eukprot:KYR01332.1 hypothetical protein DLAC_02056 [Tieghemostelium lacteum]